jgi:hypothetical protein
MRRIASAYTTIRANVLTGKALSCGIAQGIVTKNGLMLSISFLRNPCFAFQTVQCFLFSERGEQPEQCWRYRWILFLFIDIVTFY